MRKKQHQLRLCAGGAPRVPRPQRVAPARYSEIAYQVMPLDGEWLESQISGMWSWWRGHWHGCWRRREDAEDTEVRLPVGRPGLKGMWLSRV